MQISLFDKEGRIATSPVYVAYMILKAFQKRRLHEMSIFRLCKFLKELDNGADTKQLFYGLMFLRMSGVIELDGMIVRIVK